MFKTILLSVLCLPFSVFSIYVDEDKFTRLTDAYIAMLQDRTDGDVHAFPYSHYHNLGELQGIEKCRALLELCKYGD